MSTTPAPAATAEARQIIILRSGANWFFWIAGLSVINSVIAATGSNLNFVVGLGATQAVDAFGSVVIGGSAGTVIALVFDALLAAGFAGLGLAARKGASWGFIVGHVALRSRRPAAGLGDRLAERGVSCLRPLLSLQRLSRQP